jgi:hypothetical protein
MGNAFSLSKEDLLKVVKGAAIAAGGAVAVYLTNWLGVTDFGPWTPFATAAAAILTNLARKYLTDTTEKQSTK